MEDDSQKKASIPIHIIICSPFYSNVSNVVSQRWNRKENNLTRARIHIYLELTVGEKYIPT